MVTKATKEMKIAMSKDMLLYTNLTLTEISRRLGFSNEGDFRGFFRRAVHTTPLKWRAGHHLYNPSITQTTSRILRLTEVLNLEDFKHQTWYLSPKLITPVETIDAIIIDNCIAITTARQNIETTPSLRMHYQPSLRRIDTKCQALRRDGGTLELDISVSTRNSTVHVDVASSKQPLETVVLQITFKISSPVLPEGAVLWSSLL